MQQHFKQLVENALFLQEQDIKYFTFSQFALSSTKTMCLFLSEL